ncbi:MAG: DUF1566 domain-containing protein [Campylobacterota bacterium]|nr:DUF1566 domain-containing protein [Campylobacterota bacterium]
MIKRFLGSLVLGSILLTTSFSLNLFADVNLGILATGQTVSYQSGDDGDYQRGIKRSFTRDDTKQIVTDNVTGLIWQDEPYNETIDGDYYWESTPNGKLQTWEGAKSYCSTLSFANSSDWRLPTVKELLSIVDNSKNNPAIFDGFENIKSSAYWSSQEYKESSSYAWGVDFGSGYSGYGKSDTFYVRCVRGGQ